ncbi:MAG TPA: sulfite exporter TauE/SafE family protein [Thermomicrobiales bacterium]|nr:sulfite exporter TauE/SafE family protein [Thermomicrobiales bacterium]
MDSFVPAFDPAFLAAVAIVFLAAATSGLAGFGFSIISVTPLLMFHDPGTVLAINKILTLGTTWIILIGIWQAISWTRLARVVPFALVGLFAGVWVLKQLDSDTIRLIVALMVMAFALILLSGIVRQLPDRPWMAPVTGLVSGISSTSTGMSGPPLVLYFTVIGLSVEVFRATTVMYFILLDLVGFPTLIAQGLITREDVVLSLWLAPAALLGRWVGSLLVPYVTPASFRRIVLGLLLATGGIAIINVLAIQ